MSINKKVNLNVQLLRPNSKLLEADASFKLALEEYNVRESITTYNKLEEDYKAVIEEVHREVNHLIVVFGSLRWDLKTKNKLSSEQQKQLWGYLLNGESFRAILEELQHFKNTLDFKTDTLSDIKEFFKMHYDKNANLLLDLLKEKLREPNTKIERINVNILRKNSQFINLLDSYICLRKPIINPKEDFEPLINCANAILSETKKEFLWIEEVQLNFLKEIKKEKPSFTLKDMKEYLIELNGNVKIFEDTVTSFDIFLGGHSDFNSSLVQEIFDFLNTNYLSKKKLLDSLLEKI